MFLLILFVIIYKQKELIKKLVLTIATMLVGFTMYIGYGDLPKNFLAENQTIETNIMNLEHSIINEKKLQKY